MGSIRTLHVYTSRRLFTHCIKVKEEEKSNNNTYTTERPFPLVAYVEYSRDALPSLITRWDQGKIEDSKETKEWYTPTACPVQGRMKERKGDRQLRTRESRNGREKQRIEREGRKERVRDESHRGAPSCVTRGNIRVWSFLTTHHPQLMQPERSHTIFFSAQILFLPSFALISFFFLWM